MSINGIGAGYLPTGYTNNNAAKAETGKTFADIVNRKSSEAGKEVKRDLTAPVLDSIAAHAPDEVKQAFLEAEKETGGSMM